MKKAIRIINIMQDKGYRSTKNTVKKKKKNTYGTEKKKQHIT